MLHDSLEDSDITVDELSAIGLGPVVVNAIVFTTDEPGHNRKTRKARTYERMARQRAQYQNDPLGNLSIKIGILVKVADRLANVTNSVANNPGLLKMYKKEAARFKETLFVPGLNDEMWEELESLLPI